MPCKNDYVNYGTQGICRIEDIRVLKLTPGSGGRSYYILRPVHQEHASIFVPTDSQALLARMRPILSPAEIDRIILSVKGQAMGWICDRKERAAQFQAILSRRDERELLLLIRCLCLRSREDPKGLTDGEAQVLKKAEQIIDQEFSFSLNLSQQAIGSYIRGKLGLSGQMGA